LKWWEKDYYVWVLVGGLHGEESMPAMAISTRLTPRRFVPQYTIFPYMDLRKLNKIIKIYFSRRVAQGRHEAVTARSALEAAVPDQEASLRQEASAFLSLSAVSSGVVSRVYIPAPVSALAAYFSLPSGLYMP